MHGLGIVLCMAWMWEEGRTMLAVSANSVSCRRITFIKMEVPAYMYIIRYRGEETSVRRCEDEIGVILRAIADFLGGRLIPLQQPATCYFASGKACCWVPFGLVIRTFGRISRKDVGFN